jgi:uncharacterized protein (DUF1330 family)
MAAYWLARAVVNDSAEYKKYADLVPEIIAKYHGKVHARGGNFKQLEGRERYKRHIVIEFPTFDDAIACFESTEYQEARKFRLDGVGDNELVIVEGGDATN